MTHRRRRLRVVGIAWSISTIGLLLGACGSPGDGDADGSGTTGSATDSPVDATGAESGPGTSTTTGGDDTGSGSSESSEGSGSESSGGPTPTGPDRVGVFAPSLNYFELDVDDVPLRFHFGNSNSRWGAVAWPVAGDWDGNGTDTVALYDLWDRSFVVSDQNDSDEFVDRGARVRLTDVPEPPPVEGEAPEVIPLAGDWDGDGVDGLGIFHVGSNTAYLRNGTDEGPPDVTRTFDPADGYPAGALAMAGDFDGDGDDEVGLFDGTTVYLRFSLEPGAPDASFGAQGLALAGDFDGDGVDTIATFDPATNTFAIRSENTEGAGVEEHTFGHAEPDFWTWIPLAGAWDVPAAPVASDGFDWPEAAPGDVGIDANALEAALTDGANVANVHAVLVTRNGQLSGERYYHGYDRHIAGNIKSVSKSVLSALFGIAFADGTLAAIEDPVADYLPSYFAGLSPDKQSITLADIMTMRGGLEWSESTYVTGLVLSPDYVEHVLGLPLVSTPGTTYNYSTGLTHLGSAVLTEATGQSAITFARDRLFEPLSISAPRWDGSPEGYPTGGAEMWMRPRDMARFGQLYLEGGTLDGEAILVPQWVEASAAPFVPEANGRLYGLWWRERNWTNYPFDDSYFAWGYGGQFIFLFPTWDLIVVVTSKWTVDGPTSGASADAIFTYVDTQILPTMN